MIYSHTDMVSVKCSHLIKIFDPIAEDRSKWTKSFMCLGLNCLSAVKPVRQFQCGNEALVGSDALVRAETAPLLYNITSCDRVELCPRARTRCRTINGFDVRAARTQGGEVDANAATTCHNLGHDFEVVEDALAAIF